MWVKLVHIGGGHREMGRYPRRVREAAIKCIPCNAPVVRTVSGEYVCVECGVSPVQDRVEGSELAVEERGAGDLEHAMGL